MAAKPGEKLESQYFDCFETVWKGMKSVKVETICPTFLLNRPLIYFLDPGSSQTSKMKQWKPKIRKMMISMSSSKDDYDGKAKILISFALSFFLSRLFVFHLFTLLFFPSFSLSSLLSSSSIEDDFLTFFPTSLLIVCVGFVCNYQ